MKQVPKEINGVEVAHSGEAYMPSLKSSDEKHVMQDARFLELDNGDEVYFCLLCGKFYAGSPDNWLSLARSMRSHMSHHARNPVSGNADQSSETDLLDQMTRIAERLSQAASTATELADVLSDAFASLGELVKNLPVADAETIRKAEKYDRMRELMN